MVNLILRCSQDFMTLWQGIAFRDQSSYAPSQWETSLHCNDGSHWLGAYPDRSLRFPYYWSLVTGIHGFRQKCPVMWSFHCCQPEQAVAETRSCRWFETPWRLCVITVMRDKHRFGEDTEFLLLLPIRNSLVDHPIRTTFIALNSPVW